MSDDIDPIARLAYAEGTSPIDWAINLAFWQIEVRTDVVASRQRDPNAYPSYHLALDDQAVARRIIGNLLDAGWTPPDTPTQDTP
ncbi:hypothetical protein ACQEVZ_38695 [Dactylosporangium sp. CA-152071]|uniref:hypothetical protein n=1 Tax=Dactylosporangium sp. CA-152071 TaxID=3239933 RepID=UPI003D8AE78E